MPAQVDIKELVSEVAKEFAQKFELPLESILFHLESIDKKINKTKEPKSPFSSLEKQFSKIFDFESSLAKENKIPTVLIKNFEEIQERLEDQTSLTPKEQKPINENSLFEKNAFEQTSQFLENIYNRAIKTFAPVSENKLIEKEKVKDVNVKEIPFNSSFEQTKNINENSEILTNEDKPKSLIEKEKIANVKIVGFGEKPIEFFKTQLPTFLSDKFKPWFQELLNLKNEKPKDSSSTEKPKWELPGMGMLKGALAVLGILGGAITLLHGLSNEGPLKGLEKIVGTGLLKFGLKDILPKMLGSFGAKFIKLPIIGTLISIGFAVSRFKSGDYLGGGIDLLSGIAALVPGPGTMISFGLDALNAVLDIAGGGSSQEASKKKEGMLSGWLGKLFKWIAIPLKKIPGIGLIIGIGSAAIRFKNGQIFRGAMEILSGIASLYPGIGTAISFGIDALTTLIDAQEASPETKKQNEKIDLWGQIKKWGLYALSKIPFIGFVVGLGKAWNRIKSGQVFRGSLELLSGIATFFPGIGTAFSIGIDALVAFMDAKEPAPSQQSLGNTPKENPFEALKKSIIEKARKWWKSTWEWVKWLARKILPDNIIKFLDNDKPEKETNLTQTIESNQTSSESSQQPTRQATNTEPIATEPKIKPKTEATKTTTLTDDGYKKLKEMNILQRAFIFARYPEFKQQYDQKGVEEYTKESKKSLETFSTQEKNITSNNSISNNLTENSLSSTTSNETKTLSEQITDKQFEYIKNLHFIQRGIFFTFYPQYKKLFEEKLAKQIEEKTPKATEIFNPISANNQQIQEQNQNQPPIKNNLTKWNQDAAKEIVPEVQAKLETPLTEIKDKKQTPNSFEAFYKQLEQTEPEFIEKFKQSKKELNEAEKHYELFAQSKLPENIREDIQKKDPKQTIASLIVDAQTQAREQHQKVIDEQVGKFRIYLKKIQTQKEKETETKTSADMREAESTLVETNKLIEQLAPIEQLAQNKSEQAKTPELAPIKSEQAKTPELAANKLEEVSSNEAQKIVKQILDKNPSEAELSALANEYEKKLKKASGKEALILSEVHAELLGSFGREYHEDQKKLNEFLKPFSSNFKKQQENIKPISDSKDSEVETTPSLKEQSHLTNNELKIDSSILKEIANHTGNSNQNLNTLASGFNQMAKALEKVGEAVGEKIKVPPVVVNNNKSDNSKGNKASTTEVVKRGNPVIAQFRSSMENLRTIPA